MTSEASRGLPLFESDRIRGWIYNLICDFSSVYYVSPHTICVLDNKFHLVLTMGIPEANEADLERRFQRYQRLRKGRRKIWDPASAGRWHTRLTDLSMFMKDLNQWIACYVNHELGARGPVFGQRFKSCLIEGGPALFTSMASLELQPIRQKLTSDLRDYGYSSLGRLLREGEATGVTFPEQCLVETCCSESCQRLFSTGVMAISRAENCSRSMLKRIADQGLFPGETMDSGTLFRKIKWLVNSVVIGSMAFCEEAMYGYSGHRNRRFHPISGWLYSNHVRAGPYMH